MTKTKPAAASKSSTNRAKKAKTAKRALSVDNPGRVLKRSRYSKAETYAVFERFHAANPEPEGELNYVNAFTLLVAVVLSAQATDVGVNKATKHLFEIADTPEKMVALGEDTVREKIRTIGLFKTKAKNVILLSEQLLRDHGGLVPENREALEKLPGVGRKTANVVLNIYFGHPTIAVDTHLFRLGNRLGIAPGKTPLEVELAMEKAVPIEFGRHAHHWLILHGRYICKARKPDCAQCLIYDLCKSPEKEKLEHIPQIALQTAAKCSKQATL
ncbi:DNA-(apurinic or apyrimidinic site) lyase /endonuclease III [Roseibium hamelinense]|uniref:Endonuclease III n=1 Tax=Roseibium hamelinense TaxID=150831 RepID=A0A562SPE4_9HYPH|nr:endonuclease III [Roseibium hamelinense]MTI44389.1 endonuclease III [Roseibium hamelinense]TWI82834.1 DNA-(apurinic or apyrimidinic site) lyase /endonuclease III [Roseibium hamelinense]